MFSSAHIKDVIEAARTIVKFSNHSNSFCHDLQALQKVSISFFILNLFLIAFFCFLFTIFLQAKDGDCKPLLLTQDVPTRWNSTFMMINRWDHVSFFTMFLFTISPFHHFTMSTRFVLMKEFLVPMLAKTEWKKKVKVTIAEEDWELMEKIVAVLQVIVVQFVSRWRC